MNLAIRVVGRISLTVARVPPLLEPLSPRDPLVASVLMKDLFRVLQAGGGYHPQFADRDDRPLTAKATGVLRRHVGDARAALDDALADLGAEADDFKLARGFAPLLDREAVSEMAALLPLIRARHAVFKAVMSVDDAVTEEERTAALDRVASSLRLSPAGVDKSLTADRGVEQALSEFDLRRMPDELFAQYNLSLAQTALFGATKVWVRSSDPKAVVSTIERLRPAYEIRKTDTGREAVATSPDALLQ